MMPTKMVEAPVKSAVVASPRQGIALDTLTLSRCLGRAALLACVAGLLCLVLGLAFVPPVFLLSMQLIGFAILLGVLSYGFKTGA